MNRSLIEDRDYLSESHQTHATVSLWHSNAENGQWWPQWINN